MHYLKISLSVSDDKNNSVSLRLFPDVCFGLLVEVYLPETSIVFIFNFCADICVIKENSILSPYRLLITKRT